MNGKLIFVVLQILFGFFLFASTISIFFIFLVSLLDFCHKTKQKKSSISMTFLRNKRNKQNKPDIHISIRKSKYSFVTFIHQNFTITIRLIDKKDTLTKLEISKKLKLNQSMFCSDARNGKEKTTE